MTEPSNDAPSGEGPDIFGLGTYLRAQRRLANLTLRQMADLAGVSNPYLSQIERGLHEPSVRVLRAIAEALNLSAETVLAQAGLLSQTETAAPTGTEAAIRRDPYLTEDQKLALLSVYRSYRASGDAAEGNDREPAPSRQAGPGRPAGARSRRSPKT